MIRYGISQICPQCKQEHSAGPVLDVVKRTPTKQVQWEQSAISRLVQLLIPNEPSLRESVVSPGAEGCSPGLCRSVVQPIRRFAKLILCLFRVATRRVQVLVAEDLGQAHEVVLVVRQELMSHRVPQQVRMELEAADRTVFVAQVPHASIRQWSTFTDEDINRGDRRPSTEPRLKGTSSGERHRIPSTTSAVRAWLQRASRTGASSHGLERTARPCFRLGSSGGIRYLLPRERARHTARPPVRRSKGPQ